MFLHRSILPKDYASKLLGRHGLRRPGDKGYVAAVAVPGLLPARDLAVPALAGLAPPALAQLHDADRDRDGDQRADAGDAGEETLSRAAGERRLEGLALQPDDDRGDHAARRQAEQEQAEEQHDDQPAAAGLAWRRQQLRKVGAGDPGGRHQVGGEHAHLLGAAGDDRGDALGGLGRAAAGADRLAGHGAPHQCLVRLPTDTV